MNYFKSKDVKVFPSAFRGRYGDNGSQFDPEAISQSEYNIVHSGGGLNNNIDYIISYEDNKLICVIGGYYFEISNFSAYDVNNKHLNIKLKDYPLTDSTNNYDPGRVTYTLASWKEDATALDQEIDGEYYFTGIEIADASHGSSLQAYKNNKINYSEFLPQINSGSGISSVNGMPNAIRFGAESNEASEEASVAFGENTKALGKNSIAEGKNTVAKGDSAHASGFGADNATSYTIEGISEDRLTLTLNDIHNLKVGSYLTYKDENGINKSYAAVDKVLDDTKVTLKTILDGITTNTTIYLVSNAAIGDATFTNGNSNTAFGNYSHAEGTGTIASGESSHSEGNLTEASGKYSHAEGSNTIASALKAHAEGDGTTASGTGAHAEGNTTTASGANSHAEGNTTIASGNSSHAEGQLSQAKANYSHAEGIQTITNTGIGAHAEGKFTKATGEASHAEGGNEIVESGTQKYNEARGKYSHVEGVNTLTGANAIGAHAEGEGGTNKGAYGAYSHVEGYQTKTKATASNDDGGKYAHAEGYQTEANSVAAHAEGASTKAEARNAHAEGQYTRALGIASHAEGGNDIVENPSEQNPQNYNIANGQYSHVEGINTTTTIAALGAHAEGRDTITEGEYAHAEGYKTKATGNISHAEGEETVAESISSHAEGYKTTASGYKSHAEGDNTSAKGESSHAEGYSTTVSASGKYAHAEGYQTTVNGEHSHAEGYQATALCKGSHAEGLSTKANGEYSHAEGNNTEARGNYSKAAGTYTVANNENEVVIGKYNKYENNDKRLFVVGDGSADNRKNAFEIVKDEAKIKQGGYELKLGEVSLNEIIRTSLLDFIYPVGSFYISEKQDENTASDADKNGCPIAALGGKWARVEGRMLYAAEVTGQNIDEAFTIGHEDGQKDWYLIKHQHDVTLGTSVNTSHRSLTGTIEAPGFLNGKISGDYQDWGTKLFKVDETGIITLENTDKRKGTVDDVVGGGNVQTSQKIKINASHSHTFNPNDLGLKIQDRGMGPVVTNPDAPNDIRIVNGNMPPYLCVYIWKRIK